MEFYIATTLVFLAVDIMACLALNLQFGVSGILNFGFILFQAVGAYTVGVLTLGPDTGNGGFQHYVAGIHLPFVVALLIAGLIGALLAVPVGWIGVRRLRNDLQAVVLLVISIIGTTVAVNQEGLVNGSVGLSLIPHPFSDFIHLSTVNYDLFYAALALAFCGATYFFFYRMQRAPLWRTLRAIRDNEVAAEALGRDVAQLRMIAMVVGGAVAAISGGVLVGYIGIWAPSTWLYPETIVYLGAIIIGGAGTNRGAALGALLLPVIFIQGTQFLPEIGRPGLIDALDWVATGLLIIAFVWLWPRGILPEKPKRFPRLSTPGGLPIDELAGPTYGGSPDRPRVDVLMPGNGGRPVATPASDEWINRERVAQALLSVHDLHCEFGGVRAVDGVSCDVRAGWITGLIGPNGAGKSTLIKAICGELKPLSGTVVFDGRNITNWAPHRVARLGVIRTFQISSEFSRLSVLENLLVGAVEIGGESLVGSLFGRRAWGSAEAAAVERARQLLAEFRMAEMESAIGAELSGGQRRLVEIMRALMSEPRFLVMDEPLAGVHKTMIGTIIGHLQRLRDAGLTILMVEHELATVDELCDSVVVMAQGAVIATGTMAEVRREQRVLDAYLIG